MRTITTRILLLLTGLLLHQVIFGQSIRRFNSIIKPMTLDEKVAAADHLLDLGLHFSALGFYHEAIQEDTSNIEVLYKQAECYRHLRYYYEASEAYRAVYEKSPSNFPLALLWYGSMIMAESNYQPSLEIFERFIEIRPPVEQRYIQLAERFRETALFAEKFIEEKKQIAIEGMNPTVNTPYTTFSACEKDTSYLYFTGVLSRQMA